MATISRERPTPANGEPEAAEPTMIMTDAIVSRYSTTMRSAAVLNGHTPPTGISSAVTNTLTRPSSGALKNQKRFALRGTMVSLPRHFR